MKNVDDLVFAAYTKYTGAASWAFEELAEAVKKAVAARCAEIASEVSKSYDTTEGFPSLHAVGAETVAVTIRRAFELEVKP